jgi:hypothetical protein
MDVDCFKVQKSKHEGHFKGVITRRSKDDRLLARELGQ